MIRIIAIQKYGVERRNIETPETSVSTTDPCFQALSTPRRRPSAAVTTDDRVKRNKVHGK